MTVKTNCKLALLLTFLSGGFLMFCSAAYGGTAAYVVSAIVVAAAGIALVSAVGATLIRHHTIRILCDAIAMRLAPVEFLHNKNRRLFFRAMEALFEERHSAAEQMFLKLASEISDNIKKSDKFSDDDNADIAAYCVFWAAKCALARESYDSALREFSLAESLKQNHTDTLHELGKLYYSAEKFDLSKQYFKKAEQYNANDKKACFWLASIYDKTNEYDKALVWVEKSCKIDRSYTPSLCLGASLYKKTGRENLADLYFRKAVYAGIPYDCAAKMEEDFAGKADCKAESSD